MRVTEIVANYFPRRSHRPIAVTIDVLILVVLLALIYFGCAISAHTWAQTTTVLYWPVGLGYASMPVGMILCLVFQAANMIIDVRTPPNTATGPFAPTPIDLKGFE